MAMALLIPRFSVRTLLAALGLLSVCFALIAWRLRLGILLSILLLAILTVAFGKLQRQTILVRLGLGAAMVVGLLLFVDLACVTIADGRIAAPLNVIVLDSNT